MWAWYPCFLPSSGKTSITLESYVILSPDLILLLPVNLKNLIPDFVFYTSVFPNDFSFCVGIPQDNHTRGYDFLQQKDNKASLAKGKYE